MGASSRQEGNRRDTVTRCREEDQREHPERQRRYGSDARDDDRDAA
jgi:hypothetical protein